MEIRVNCPDAIHLRPGSPARRRDRKRKLHLNPEKNAAHCWRCGYGTYHADTLVATYHLPVPAHIRFETVASPESTSPAAVCLPDAFTQEWQTPTGQRAWQYLRHRGLPPSVILGYGLGYCAYGPYANRVVIPVYTHGELMTWQARDITGLQPIRYLGPAQPNRGGVCFNLDRVRRRRVLVLTEGPFDALAIPAFGVALLGTQHGVLHAQHLRLLLDAAPAAVIVSFDADATAEQTKVVQQLWGLVPHVETWQPTHASDLGACSPSEKTPLLLRCAALEAQACSRGHGA